MNSIIKSLYKEPLLHFLVLALGLFYLHSVISHDELELDQKRIVVDQENLLKFIQFRTKSFESVTAQNQLDALSAEELDKIINDYVREEALYREAQNLGLGRDDYVIKRRLIQKVDYIARGFAESFGEVTEEDVQTYFEQNKEQYFIVPRITFTHVFYSAGRHGTEKAKTLAEQKLVELQQTEATFNDASKHGERFLYGLNYVERSELFVESHFGPEMSKQLFGLAPDQNRWHGPIMSSQGAHLVMVAQKQEGRMPALDEVRARVTQEAQRAMTEKRAREATQKIIEGYDIDIVYQKSTEKLAQLDQKGSE